MAALRGVSYYQWIQTWCLTRSGRLHVLWVVKGLRTVKHNQRRVLGEPCCPAASVISLHLFKVFWRRVGGWTLLLFKLTQEAIIHPITRSARLNLPLAASQSCPPSNPWPTPQWTIQTTEEALERKRLTHISSRCTRCRD